MYQVLLCSGSFHICLDDPLVFFQFSIHGVPQGLILGAFTISVISVPSSEHGDACIFKDISYHCCTDVIKLYILFKPHMFLHYRSCTGVGWLTANFFSNIMRRK